MKTRIQKLIFFIRERIFKDSLIRREYSEFTSKLFQKNNDFLNHYGNNRSYLLKNQCFDSNLAVRCMDQLNKEQIYQAKNRIISN